MYRFLVLLGCMLAGQAFAQSDLRGSSDHPSMERFPLSYIVSYSGRDVPEYRLILGGLEKVDGVIRPEKEKRSKGDLTRITYRIPPGHTALEPFNVMRDQLKTQGAEILFQCDGRDCGSSNYWANSVFRISRLYGVDQTQNYLVAQKGSTYFVIYTVTRGNKRVYAHVEILESLQNDITAQLQSQGFVRVPDQMELPETLYEYLQANPDVLLWVVGFDRASGSVDESLARSQQAVDRLSRDVSSRVGEAQVRVFAAGALAPLMVRDGEAGIYLIRE